MSTISTDKIEWPPIVELGRVLGFFASVIKSGEGWSPTCQAEYDSANAAIKALYAALRSQPEDGWRPRTSESIKSRFAELYQIAAEEGTTINLPSQDTAEALATVLPDAAIFLRDDGCFAVSADLGPYRLNLTATRKWTVSGTIVERSLPPSP